MEKEMVNQVQEAQRVPYRINTRRNMPKHILIKLTKTKHKERILECIGQCWLPYPSAAAAAKSLQSCPTLCDPIDSSPPGSPVPGILQARTLEWVAISFSNA